MTATLEKKVAQRVGGSDIDAVLQKVQGISGALDQYAYIAQVRADNEALFYAALQTHPKELLPVVYTPGVAEACKNWGKLSNKPDALILSLDDKGNVKDKMKEYVQGREIDAVVVTDGGRILGLGDLGANGIGIPVGKSFLYSGTAGVPPARLLPTVLDVGCSDEELRGDSERYIGKDRDRLTGEEYDEFLAEWHSAVQSLFGKNTLIHWEDFDGSNASRLLHKYEDSGPSFNDDIQSTAAVAVASILGACHAECALPIVQQRNFVFMGAGEANLGIASLLVAELTNNGVSKQDAKGRIWMVDSGGLIAYGRERKITEEKGQFARSKEDAQEVGLEGGAQLADCVAKIQPTVLIGAAGKGGVFTKEILATMSQNMPELRSNDSGSSRNCGVKGLRSSKAAAPIVLALSNPTDNSECSFQDAWDATDGRVLFAAGSPFDNIETDEGRLEASQANNALIYPGLGAATILSGAAKVPQSFFLAAAHALADEVTEAEFARGLVVPPVVRISDAARAVTARVCVQALEDGLASERGNDAVMSAAKKAQGDKGKEQGLKDAIDEWRF